MHVVWILSFLGLFVVPPTAADPGRDVCKIYGGGLKCSHMISQYFPYDAFLSFNDDLAQFTTDMKFLQIENSNISILQSRSFQRTPHLSHLFLSGIEIDEIESGAFDGLTRLKSADLSNNKFSVIPVDSFKHTKILRLNLNYNEMMRMPLTGPFLSAPHLTWLTLKHCNVEELPERAFAELPALMHLDLSENKLKTLPEKVFAPLKRLIYLDLSKNEFEQIEPKVFESISFRPKHSTMVALSGNPFICDCKIARIVTWMTKRGGNFSGLNVSCRKPEVISWKSELFLQLMISCQS